MPGQARQQGQQRARQGLVRDGSVQVQAGLGAAALEAPEVRVQALEISGAQARGVALDRLAGAAWVLEAQHAALGPGELELVAVQHLHEHDVVAAAAQGREAAQELLVGVRAGWVGVEQVGEQEHEAAAREGRGDGGDQVGQGAHAGGFAGEGVGEGAEARGTGARSQLGELERAVAAEGEAEVVALAEGEVGEGGGEGGGVALLVAGTCPIGHTAGGVDEQDERERVLGVGLTEDEAVAAGDGAPVDASRVIAGGVGDVAAELVAEPGAHAGVSARVGSADGPCEHELTAAQEVAQLGRDDGGERLCGVLGHVLGASSGGDGVEDAGEDLRDADGAALGGEAADEAVLEHGRGEGADVGDGDGGAAVEGGAGLGGGDELLAGAGSGAPL